MLHRIVVPLHDILESRDRAVLTAAAIVLITALAVASRAELDMSFRPLFAHDDSTAAATAAFEARFGQTSGATIAVLVERDLPLDADLLAAVAALTQRIGRVDGVREVLSPARVSALEWSRAGARATLIADPAQLSDPVAAAHALPEIGASRLVADSGRVLLLLARLAPPLDALDERRAIIREIRDVAGAWRPPGVRVHHTGVSVVESAYASAVPQGMAASLLLTTAAVALLLYALFGHWSAVLAALAGVAIATPLTMSLLVLAGRPLTILGTMAPTVILVIGAADAIHMIRRWQLEVRVTETGAVRRMLRTMALPCALTTVTTALGFTALIAARIEAIREFGLLVAIGVMLVFAANVVLVPTVLRRFGRRIPTLVPGSGRPLLGLGVRLTRNPRPALAGALLFTAAAGAGVLYLDVDQRFNEELPARHPATMAQNALERHFGGFLGPDIEITRTDGGSILAADAVAMLTSLRESLAGMPDVASVSSLIDILPSRSGPFIRPILDGLREDPLVGPAVKARLHTSERTALHVSVPDLGTAAAAQLVRDIERAAAQLPPQFEARVVGQWWLAQLGMSSLLRDMLVSFATSALLVLPILALALRSRRLLLIALPPNLLPLVAALGWMGWTGTTLRIGTALVMAVALAIAVDDTIHLLSHAESARRKGMSPTRSIHRALAETGPALVGTTIVLLAGFLSMVPSPLRAVSDMGIVAAIALTTALMADLLVLPPLYGLLQPSRLRHPHRRSTSFVGSRPDPGPGRLASIRTTHVR